MTSRKALPVPSMIISSGIDSFEAKALINRLDEAAVLAKNCVRRSTIWSPQPSRNDHNYRDIKRHHSVYLPTDDAGSFDYPKAEENCFDVNTGRIGVRQGIDMVSLSRTPTKSQFGLTLEEPIAYDLSNDIPACERSQQIKDMISRWKDWINQIVPPMAHDKINKFDRVIQDRLNLIFEIIKLSEPAYDNQQIFFHVNLGTPFELPQIMVSDVGSKSLKRNFSALTRDGQMLLRSLFPIALQVDQGFHLNMITLSIRSRKIGGDWMGSDISRTDVLKTIDDLGIKDIRPLVNRLPR